MDCPNDPAADLVTHNRFESSLDDARKNISDPHAGFFGVDSITWKVDRESALFLGAGRAALLQLAHPWVAVALEQHSSLLSNPIARFHNTFRILFTMVFGSAPQGIAAARSLHQLHTRINGSMPSAIARYAQGSHYDANQVDALKWVFATLVQSAVLAYECVLPPLSVAEREAYYRESCVLAHLFGIPRPALPQDWNAFIAYIESMLCSENLGVDERARAMAQKLLAGAGSWIRPPRWYSCLTAFWIPERFRAAFGLPFGHEEASAAARAERWLPAAYRRLPNALRFVGPFQEAQARLASHPPGAWVTVCNRFWIGGKRLPFAENAAQGLVGSPSTSASHSASRLER